MNTAVKLRCTHWLVKSSWWPACQVLMAVQHQASFCTGKGRNKGDPESIFSHAQLNNGGENISAVHHFNSSITPSVPQRLQGHQDHVNITTISIPMTNVRSFPWQDMVRYLVGVCSSSWCSVSIISSPRLHP